jgi:Domain of unknown function (DUF4388)/PEGA domain
MTDRRPLKTSRIDPEAVPRDGRIYGKLGSVGLNDILQLLGMGHRTATVRLENQGQQGRIYFRDGVLLHATAGSTEGERALLKLVNWQEASFVIEDGLEGDPPATISKNVDTVMLGLLTRLDEGWVPEMTPFPLLDRPTTSPAVLDARPKPRTPPKPRPRPARRPTKVLVAAASMVLATAAAAAGVAFIYPGTDLAGLPPVSIADLERVPPGESGIAAEILQGSIEDGPRDAATVLAAHGLFLSGPQTPGANGDGVPHADAAPASEVPPPPQASEFGHLLVLVEPWAEVGVDGVQKGQTPLPEMRLTAGGHELVLSNPNFVGVIRDRIQVIAGQSIQRKYSFNDSGTLRLLVRPWADVYVDGRHAGQTPIGALQLPRGSHTILMRHPELGEKSAVVDVFQDRETVLEVEM